MKFCPECGAKLVSNETKFCHECGANLKKLYSEAKETGNSKNDDNRETKVTDNNDVNNASCDLNVDSPKKSNESEELDNNSAASKDFAEKSKCDDDSIDTSTVEVFERDSESKRANIESSDETDPDKVPCCKLETSHTKEDFIREAWISLARDNVPVEVFECDFSEPKVTDQEIYVRTIDVKLSYDASIGYDRQEPYIAYENYTEKEPYIATETYYDYGEKRNKTRQVTKYKDVTRQRQVTRYKTVTDWQPFSGSGTTDSIATVSNCDSDIDEKLFRDSYLSRENKNAPTTHYGVATPSAKSEALDVHNRDFMHYVYNSLPGDHSKNERYQVEEIVNLYETIFCVQQYSATIDFENKTYKKYAYPFGKMKAAGDIIENKQSPLEVKRQLENKMLEENKAEEEKRDYTVWSRTKWLSIATMLLLISSIVLCCFLRYPVPLIVVFVLAVASYIACNIMFRKNKKSVDEMIREHKAERLEKTCKEIENYSENYRAKMLEALNKKLKSLGLEPIKEEDF